MQVCGVLAGRRLDEVDSVFQVSSRINSTWGGNLVDMVRSQRYVEIIEQDNLLDNATAVGAHLLEGLQRLEETFPGQVSNSRGRGMFVAFDLPDGDTRDRVLATMLDADVLGLASGERAVRFRPSLTLTRAEADEGLDRLTRALSATL
jgi:L-lysine 6-transaminase